MNFLDILIAIPLGYLIYKGFRRGIIFEAFSLLGILAGSVLAVRFSHWLAELLAIDKNGMLISFFLIFIAVVILSLILARLLERFVKLVHVGAVNNILGALVGMLKGVCIIGVLLYFIAVIDIREKVLTHDVKTSSALYRPVERSGKKIAGRIEFYIGQRKSKHEQQEDYL